MFPEEERETMFRDLGAALPYGDDEGFNRSRTTMTKCSSVHEVDFQEEAATLQNRALPLVKYRLPQRL